MVQFFSQLFNYDHPWTHVNLGIWQKYPNPHTGHVVSVDVLARSIDVETGIVRTERILGCKQATPKWVVKMLGGSDDAYVREVSFVDPATSRTTITSENLSLSQYLTVLEQITYERDPTSPNARTQFKQTAEIQSRMGLWKSVGERLEKYSVERFSMNAKLGREGLEYVLGHLERRHMDRTALVDS